MRTILHPLNDMHLLLKRALRYCAQAPQFDCDWNERERVVNVATSLPYLLVGADMVRHVSASFSSQVACIVYGSTTCARYFYDRNHSAVSGSALPSA
jgi:hypothetical protein